MFIPTIIIISFVFFFIIQLPPGDYVDSYVGALAAEGEIFTEAEKEWFRLKPKPHRRETRRIRM